MKNDEKWEEMLSDIHQGMYAEYRWSQKEYEEKFNSRHEGYAIVREEYDELVAEFNKIENDLSKMWSDIKSDSGRDACRRACCAIYDLKCLIAEATQTGAVLLKYIETFGGDM